jgi:hypothetical protein
MNRTPIEYVKLQTGTNNPQVSQKMRYAQLVGTGAKLRTIHKTNGIGPDGQPLQQRVIVPLTNS